MQYGRSDALEGGNGTIIRYGNFPDHPDTPLHHKHTANGGIEAVDFDGLLERVYRDANSLHRVRRPNDLELLRILATEHPESIRETARLVDHDVRKVHRNLDELDSLNLIEFQSDGPGKPKRPIVWYNEIAIDLPLGSGDGKGEDRGKA